MTGIDFTLNEGSESAEETEIADLVKCSEEYDVYIGRAKGFKHLMNTPPGESGWLGNPFLVEEYGREKAVQLYERILREKLENHSGFRQKFKKLIGKKLGKKCEDDELCHGDIIIKILEEQENQQEGGKPS